MTNANSKTILRVCVGIFFLAIASWQLYRVGEINGFMNGWDFGTAHAPLLNASASIKALEALREGDLKSVEKFLDFQVDSAILAYAKAPQSPHPIRELTSTIGHDMFEDLVAFRRSRASSYEVYSAERDRSLREVLDKYQPSK